MGLLCLLSLWSIADAATVRIAATIDDDLRHIRGTMIVDDLPGTLLDPLQLLPEPPDDLHRFRTYPNLVSKGSVHFTTAADGTVHFVTTLPRRFGAIGATAHGLFANGGWHPQPEGLPVVDWVVQVELPTGVTAALGDQVGTGTVSWTGQAERAPLAAVRRGHITQLEQGLLLTKGKPRRRLVRELDHDLAAWPLPIQGVVVEAPLRRRLVRHGPGLAYVSDRAYRLTPGLQFAHRVPVARGVGTAWSGRPDPFERELQGAGLSLAHQEELGALEADKVLGVFAWVPQVQSLLSSRRMAFYSDILDRAWPGDRLRDDLAEMLRPQTPGTAAAAQLDDRFGEGTALEVAQRLADGVPLADALPQVDGIVAAARTLPPTQDYLLEVGNNGVRITRLAPPGTTAEVVVVRIDGDDRAIFAEPGATTIPVTESPRRVALDPDLHLRQISRRGDTWPPRYTLTAAAWVGTLNLSRGQIYGTLWSSLRRQYDTRHLWSGTLSNSRADLVRAGVGHTWKVGPLIDGFTRRHAVRLGGSASLLDPRFAATDGLRVGTDASLSWRYDTRVSTEFPLTGERVGAALTAGTVPGTTERWGGGYGSITMLGSLSPRVVVASSLSAAMARSTVPHRLLALGGQSAMRSVPVLPACVDGGEEPCAELGTERGVVALEYRWAPIRNWSVPMILLWGTELQVTGGFEAAVANIDEQLVTATGVTAGVLGVGDMLGAEQMGLGVTLGWPLSWRGLDLERRARPEIYVRMGQAF